MGRRTQLPQRPPLQSGDLADPDVQEAGDRRAAESAGRIYSRPQLQHPPKPSGQVDETPLEPMYGGPQRGRVGQRLAMPADLLHDGQC